jgi:hypothetical protein
MLKVCFRDYLAYQEIFHTLTVPMCKDIGYTMTQFPNSLGHTRQHEAGLEAHQFYPLVKINCSEHLKEFICALYFPKVIGSHDLPSAMEITSLFIITELILICIIGDVTRVQRRVPLVEQELPTLPEHLYIYNI